MYDNMKEEIATTIKIVKQSESDKNKKYLNIDDISPYLADLKEFPLSFSAI